MSQRWFAFVVVSSLASAAFAQNKAPAGAAASQVPPPPPAAPASAVPAPPPASQAPAQAPKQTPAPSPTAVPPAPTAAQPDAGTTPATPGTTPAPTPAPTAVPVPAPAPQQGPPPPPSFPQGASEPPSTTESVEVAGQAEDLPPPPPPPEPLGWFGLTLSLGYAFGGDDLEASAVRFEDGFDAEIAAGTGTQLGIGVVFMPIRTEGHSIGLSVDQSVKFADITARNLSIALVRFPLVVSARYSYAISETWHFTAGGGLVYEYGIHLSGDGDADELDADFENAVGFMAEAGAAYRERSFVIDATLRFTSLEYEPEGESAEQVGEGPFDAKSGALVVAGHYFF